MRECDYCDKKIDDFLPHKCKFCEKIHCHNHLVPESHNCVELEEHKKRNREKWRNKSTYRTNHKYGEPTKEPDKPIKIENNKSSKERQNFWNRLKNYLSARYDDLNYWLRKREQRQYDYGRGTDYLITTILLFVASIVGIAIFYSNAAKLNEINLWIIKLGGVLILVSLFFAIKFGWRLTKEGIDILKRQRNWLKYVVIILIIFLLWQAYTNRNTVLNPVFDTYNKTNFSLFTPIILGNFSGSTNQSYASNNKDNSFVSNKDNFYYGLEEGETRVKDVGFLHFDKIPIYYKLNNCSGERRERVIQAFNIIEGETEGILPFEEKSPGDIIVACNSQLETEFASGYGGPEYYIGSNKITNGSMVLYAHDPKFSRCESYPVTEIHEILHSLGFDHIYNKNSIMYEGDRIPIMLEWEESDQPHVCIEIETKITNCLKYIYSSGTKGTSCSGILFYND